MAWTDERVEKLRQMWSEGIFGNPVDPFGSVFPCVQWRRAVGNLHERPIEEIWRGAAGLDEVRRTTEEVRRMVREGGAAGAMMSFCPGAAEAQTGSPLGLYPAAAARRGLREETMAAPTSGLLPIVGQVGVVSGSGGERG